MLAKVMVLALCVFGLAVGFCIGGVLAEPRGGVRTGCSSTLLQPNSARWLCDRFAAPAKTSSIAVR